MHNHRPLPRWATNHTTQAAAERRHTELWAQLRDALAAAGASAKRGGVT